MEQELILACLLEAGHYLERHWFGPHVDQLTRHQTTGIWTDPVAKIQLLDPVKKTINMLPKLQEIRNMFYLLVFSRMTGNPFSINMKCISL